MLLLTSGFSIRLDLFSTTENENILFPVSHLFTSPCYTPKNLLHFPSPSVAVTIISVRSIPCL